jgi:peptidoglycan DL-endopeptidase CwlO
VALSALSGVRARAVQLRLPIVLCAAAALAATVIPTGVSQATPGVEASHLSLSQVEAKVNSLNLQAEKITESYDGAKTALATLQRKERITGAELTRDRALLARVESQVAAGASAAYRNGAMDPTLSLMSSADPETFLSQTSSLNEVARSEANEVAIAHAAQRQVAAAQSVHDAQVAQQRKTLAAISSQRGQIESLLHQQSVLLSHLKAAQRARLAREHAAAVRSDLAERAQAPSAGASSSGPAPTYNGAASGRAAIAIRYAYAQLGKPYQWGGAGPGSFDCSGLVMRAWGAAGVGLPHSAAGDQGMLPSVSSSELEPGDLIFYGRPAFHVALYIGGGRIIQAPHTGANVEISSVGSMTSAGRP